jgi:CelD/BcsL family acetyltransferase involved in cellulose biosynthesis
MTKISVDMVSPSELSDDDIGAWNRLCSDVPDLSIAFLSYPYALAAEKSFSAVRVRVCRVRRDGRPVAFFPLQFKSTLHRWLGVGERLGGEMSDYFGIVTEIPVDSRTLLRLCGLRALLFSHLDESQITFGLAGGTPEPGHLIDFPDGGDAFWRERRSIDKKFVADTERRERNLVRDFGQLRFHLQSPNIVEDLAKLIAAKQAQYSRTKADDALGTYSRVEFLRTLSTMNDPLCGGLLSTLHAGETWVASHFGLRCNRTLHYWFPVYNPQLSAYGPGRLLLRQILSCGQEYGISRIDRGAGDSAAKRDFSTSQHQFYKGLWSSGGVVATCYRVGLSASWRLGAISTSRQLKRNARFVSASDR